MKNSKLIYCVVLLSFILFFSTTYKSSASLNFSDFINVSNQKNDTVVGIMFYNVENLFDTYKDSLKNDEEFLPSSSRRWTYKRMKQKFTNLSRVILNAGGWNLPVIIGLCEVENSLVLNLFLKETGLYDLEYRFIHYDSPDQRGIDVALLYRRNNFKILESKPYNVDMGVGERPTRDILYVKGLLLNTDTLHLLVNHWPSRLGGTVASSPKREISAHTAKKISDSIQFYNHNAKIIIMGDFNEAPDNIMMTEILRAGKKNDTLKFINLALHAEGAQGTIKYQHQWSIFDQIIVSKSLMNDTSKIKIHKPVQKIISLPFLFEADPAFGGQRLFRTYSGFKYTGGFSDHLPVWIDLSVKR